MLTPSNIDTVRAMVFGEENASILLMNNQMLCCFAFAWQLEPSLKNMIGAFNIYFQMGYANWQI